MAAKIRKSLFERLKSGLQEGVAHAKGELTLRTIEIPEPPPEIDAKTLVDLREQAQMSQGVFAKMLFVSAKTVQSWEQGTRVPSKASRRLIQIFAQRPGVVCEVVGLRPVQLDGFKVVEFKKGKRRIVKENGDVATQNGPDR